MTEQLDRAYDLIKSEQHDDAIAILEPIIRDNRNNEDAWWLLANAYQDEEAKRNALHNVLRITTNDSRKEKAETLLQSLDADPYAFDVEANQQGQMSAYQAKDETEQKESGGLSCASISLIIVGLVGLCACAGVIGIFAVAGDIFTFVNAPDDYINGGELGIGEVYDGALTIDEATVGFTYAGESGDALILTVDSEASTAPFIIIYDMDTGAVASNGSGLSPALFQPQTFSNTLTVTFDVPESNDYLVTLRGTTLIGSEFGFGDYTLEVTSEE